MVNEVDRGVRARGGNETKYKVHDVWLSILYTVVLEVERYCSCYRLARSVCTDVWLYGLGSGVACARVVSLAWLVAVLLWRCGAMRGMSHMVCCVLCCRSALVWFM